MLDSRANLNGLPAVLGGDPAFPDGPPDWPLDDPAIEQALHRALTDRSWGKYHAENCSELRERLAAMHACEHVVLCSSGTAAIELALRGLKVGDGDEVILAAYDFKGNFQNVLTVGATPVLVDIAVNNGNLDAAFVPQAMTERTKAILVSHLHGGVVPMPRVVEIARARGIPVIEDACQMPGANLFGRPAGTWGDVGVSSFGGSKLLTAGRGGALFTNNADVVQRSRLYTFRGNEAYPLSELQAAVLLPQLQRLDERNGRRADGVAHLSARLAEIDGLCPFQNSATNVEPAYYKLGMQYNPAAFNELSRDQFAAAARAEGIALDSGFRALHLTHSSRRFRQVGELANAADADTRVLTLHHPVLLEPDARLDRLAAALARIQRHAGAIASTNRGVGQ
jgi:dTDP-4-amino-4,6-dideoxygalactose transaminase